MPGTLVRDSLAPSLAAGLTLGSAASSNGTAVEVDKPGDVRIFVANGTVTGTTPTLALVIQGADDSAFTTNVVTHGSFGASSGTAAAQSNVTRVLDIRSDKQWMRAQAVTAGTSPVYTATTILVRQGDDRRVPKTDTAAG